MRRCGMLQRAPTPGRGEARAPPLAGALVPPEAEKALSAARGRGEGHSQGVDLGGLRVLGIPPASAPRDPLPRKCFDDPAIHRKCRTRGWSLVAGEEDHGIAHMPGAYPGVEE